MSRDADDFDIRELLERHRPRIEELFRAHGVAPDGEAAMQILEAAGREVELRGRRGQDPGGRLIRAVERGCAAYFAELRSRALAAYDRSGREGDREPQPGEAPGDPAPKPSEEET